MTSVSIVESTPFSGNPIDLVEEIVIANDWAHDRASEEELVVEISGHWCDYRRDWRGVNERRPGVENGGGPARCLVLVGCGKMGAAMLRGWRAAGVASSCVVVEPTGVPAGFGSAREIAWYASPQELPTELRADALVFAVKL